MATTAGFFGTRATSGPQLTPKTKQDLRAIFVDVGGQGDCGFRALAAAIIDKALSDKLRSRELTKSLLQQHFNYFPEQQPLGHLLTSTDQIELMSKTPFSMAKLIQTMAYTLRQIAVDEIVAHPEIYRGAFFDKNETMPTTPSAMRLETTWIDETAIAAIANALNLPVQVKVVNKGKELPLQLQYGKTDTAGSLRGKPVIIQLQDNHYIPQVSQPERFEKVRTISVDPLQPASIGNNDPEMEQILATIKAEDQRLLDEFEDTRTRLLAAVTAGEITQNGLLDIYVHGMQKSDYLQGRVKYVGIEHGNQHFFDAIEGKQHGRTIVTMPNEHHEEQMTRELIHAIARAVSIGQLPSEKVFAQLETKQQRGFSPAA